MGPPKGQAKYDVLIAAESKVFALAEVRLF